MTNHISLNIKHLIVKNKLSQKEFGELFGLKQAVVSAYIREVSNPQLETLIQISNHFEVSIDDLLKSDLSEKSELPVSNYINESDSCKLCEMYERMIEDKDKLIEALERELASKDGGQSASSQTA